MPNTPSHAASVSSSHLTARCYPLRGGRCVPIGVRMRSRGFAILFLVVAGLFTPPPYTFEHAEQTIAAQAAKSDRALDRAMQDMPAISLAHKKALLACVDHHLTCTRQDLVS